MDVCKKTTSVRNNKVASNHGLAEHDLKKVTLDDGDLTDAASTLEIASYGAKKDIAARLVLEKLISASLKKA